MAHRSAPLDPRHRTGCTPDLGWERWMIGVAAAMTPVWPPAAFPVYAGDRRRRSLFRRGR
jgi:hypothetical protein